MADGQEGGRRPQATIREVAERAGVSQMTVSRVLNSPDLVKPETRARVQEAIEALRYRPNILARTLAGGRALFIGLLYDNPSHGYLSELLLGALERCRQAGHHLVVEDLSGDEAAKPSIIVNRARDGGLDGVIIIPPLSDDASVVRALREAGIACVLIAPSNPEHGDGAVSIDDAEAAASMTRYLIERGHERIGFISGPVGHSAGVIRQEGYRAALEAAGLPYEEAHVAKGAFTYRSGMMAAEHLLRTPVRPTAIFAGNDDMAAGAIAAAHRLGLKVPEDVSIAGFDDTAIASTVWPQLTTVRQPIAEMAARAVSILGREEGAEAQGPLPTSIIERASVGPPHVKA
ncbi:LacI family DNA-binding transcriptional regulator [Parvularcula dongshanensis]|uniref:LacI family transcriptional regulator n=1 Tax=Parvularcula dongshanensis TaxID=1173995 RepID=A0A840I4P5_9PROT|nr:LacI family DNA-binding transcriptional regulator [Parvularcula dongshanensis]MBB4659936.1 LacI family transcriptional regulator [Parvularcula dongshanensis]